MNYFKIIYRTGGEDWETSEILIDENQHTEIQKQMAEGLDYVLIRDKATIKRTSIVSISDANSIVASFQNQGLKVDGLIEPPSRPRLAGNVVKMGDYLKEKHESFFKKMGWKY